MTIALGGNEITPLVVDVVFSVNVERSLDLGELKLDKRIMLVAFPVIVGECFKSGVVVVLIDVVTWRFWDPVDDCKDEYASPALQKGWCPPSPVGWNFESAQDNP